MFLRHLPATALLAGAALALTACGPSADEAETRPDPTAPITDEIEEQSVDATASSVPPTTTTVPATTAPSTTVPTDTGPATTGPATTGPATTSTAPPTTAPPTTTTTAPPSDPVDPVDPVDDAAVTAAQEALDALDDLLARLDDEIDGVGSDLAADAEAQASG